MGRAPTDTKQKLIDTATDLIWRQSYNAVSVDEICKAAGVKKGSFYHYFPSKAHLALETMDSCMQETIEKYNDFFSATRPPIQRFALMARYVLDQQREISKELGHVCGCPFATLGSELAAQDKEIGEKITGALEVKSAYYESALRDLVAEGTISANTDIKQKANEIFAYIIGQLIMARIKNDLDFLESGLEKGLFDLIGVKQIEIEAKKLTA